MQRIAVAAASLAFLFSLSAPAGATSIPLTLDPSQITTESGFSRWTVELDFGDQAPDTGVISLSQHFDFTGPNKLKVSDLGLPLPFQDAARAALEQRHADLAADVATQESAVESVDQELADLYGERDELRNQRDFAQGKAVEYGAAADAAQDLKQQAEAREAVLIGHKEALEEERSDIQAFIDAAIGLAQDVLQGLLDDISDLTQDIIETTQQILQQRQQVIAQTTAEQNARQQEQNHASLVAILNPALALLDTAIATKEAERGPLAAELSRLRTLLSVVAQELAAMPEGSLAEAFELILTSLNGQPLDLLFYGELRFDIDPTLPYSLFFDGVFDDGQFQIGQFAEITDGEALISGLTINLDIPFDPAGQQDGPIFDKLTLSLIADEIEIFDPNAAVALPAPSTLALLPAGLLMFGWLNRRRLARKSSLS